MKKLAIFGVPRSGTSWLSQIFNSHPDVAMRFQPLFSYSHKGKLTPQSSKKEIEDFFNEILLSNDEFALMKSESQKNFPTFPKSNHLTHIAFKETRYLNVIENLLLQSPEIKVIGILRNPLATLASWMRAPKEFDPHWNVLEEWKKAPAKNQGRPEEYFGFDKWKESAEAFIKYKNTFPGNFLLVRYDQLNDNPIAVTETIFEFCELEFCSNVKEFIAKSQAVHEDDPYSVYRVKEGDNDWENSLPYEIITEVRSELKNSPLQTFLSESRNG